jgi:hypothetical protein
MLEFLKENECLANLSIETKEIKNHEKDCFDKYENLVYLDKILIQKFTGDDFSRDKKNYARGFFKAIEEINKKLYNLCSEIEKLPASEQQTKISLMASHLI